MAEYAYQCKNCKEHFNFTIEGEPMLDLKHLSKDCTGKIVLVGEIEKRWIDEDGIEQTYIKTLPGELC